MDLVFCMDLSDNPTLYDEIYSDLEQNLLPYDLPGMGQVDLPNGSPGYFIRLDSPIAIDPEKPTLLSQRPDYGEVVKSNAELVRVISTSIGRKYGLKAIFSNPFIDEGGCYTMYIDFQLHS